VARGSDDTANARSTRNRLRSVVRAVGAVVAILAVALCLKTLVDDWSSIRPALEHARRGWVAVALACSAASMIGLGVLWWRCLRLFQVHARPSDAIAWYFGGELGKYLPGGVWQVLGRAELALRGGLRRSTVYATTLISYGGMLVGAAVTCGVLAPIAAASGGRIGWAWLVLVLVPLGVVSTHPAISGRLLRTGNRLTKGRLTLTAPPWPRMLSLIAFSIPSWVLIGASSCALTAALGYHQQPARIAFAAVSGWIVGFLALAVPAGAGVREVTFIALAGLPGGPAVAVAAAARLALIVVDACGGLAGLWYARRAAAGREAAERPAVNVSAPPLSDGREE
jgi:glycosyltransferase 2 family protein